MSRSVYKIGDGVKLTTGMLCQVLQIILRESLSIYIFRIIKASSGEYRYLDTNIPVHPSLYSPDDALIV